MHAVSVKKDSGTVVGHVPWEKFRFPVGAGCWLAIFEEIECPSTYVLIKTSKLSNT